MHSYVIDTNFFVNLQRSLNLGENKEEVVKTFSQRFSPLLTSQKVEFLCTPSSFEELKSFFTESPESLGTLQTMLTLTSPNISDLSLNGSLFYSLIEEIGKRLYRGLRATEEIVKNVIENPPEKSRETNERYIKDLRDRYRRGTREGFLDSTIDFELILLARERNATLVSSDQGLVKWARLFGCKETLPEQFIAHLTELAKTQ